MAKARRIKGIDCHGEAVEGIRLVLEERLDEMYESRSEALHWKDPEGVHSMRVASRRLRSALQDFMPYMNRRMIGLTVKQIKEIADALGEVRDQDVAIIELEKLSAHTPPEIAPTLKGLLEARKEVRDTARRELKEFLAKDDLKQMAADCVDAFWKATNGSGKTKELSYVNMARSIIRDRLKDLDKLSKGLYRPLEVEPLHEMRIAGKRLRYAIELFQDCWQPGILHFAKRASRLQSALGRVHDCDVWIEDLGKRILKSREQVAGLTWLLSHFLRLRDRHLREALVLWKDWESQELSANLRNEIKRTGGVSA